MERNNSCSYTINPLNDNGVFDNVDDLYSVYQNYSTDEDLKLKSKSKDSNSSNSSNSTCCFNCMDCLTTYLFCCFTL